MASTKQNNNKEESSYRELWESNRKLQESDAMKTFKNVVSLTKESKRLKEELDTMRDKLKNAMKLQNCDKLYDLESGMVASLSSKGYNSNTKFDVDAFKADYPELYKKYLISSRTFSNGGTLTVRAITVKALGWFSKFILEDNLEDKFNSTSRL